MDKSYTNHFEERLWEGSPFKARSEDISPLYVDRFRGPRLGTSLSSHQFWEFTCCLEGEGTLIGENSVSLVKNSICLIPPGIMHREESAEAMDTIWIGFEAKNIPCCEDQILVVEDAGLSEFILRTWLLAGSRGLPIGPELDGRLKTMVAWFLRVLGQSTPRLHGNLSQKTMEYLEANLTSHHTMESIAGHFHCSEGHLHRVFKKDTGQSPIGFLKSMRFRRAAHLLEYGRLPIAEVALLCGFSDPFHFSRVFKQVIGCSPRDYRRPKQ